MGVVAHAVAAHLGNHIPGSPQIIVQEVPGGGSLLLANLFATPQTPRDGTVIGLASNGMPTTPLRDTLERSIRWLSRRHRRQIPSKG